MFSPMMSTHSEFGEFACEQILSRRGFLSNSFSGLAGIGLASLLGRELAAGETVETSTTAVTADRGLAQFAPKAKRVLQIFCPGGASHIDLWDYKPALEKHHGEPLPGEENLVTFQGKNGNLMKSPWPFAPAGQSGKMISTLLPNMARHVDDIAFIHSMQSKTNTHGPGCVFMNTGTIFEGFPSAGAWVGYALGSENENLPAYVAIPDIRGEPPNGKANWSNGFLPAQHQAVVMAAQQPIRNLSTPSGVSADEDVATRGFVRFLNEEHAAQNPGLSELRARINAYRAGGPDAAFCAASRRPRHGITIDTTAVRRRRCQSAQGGLCAELLARATVVGAGRSIREPLLCVAGVGRRWTFELGRPQNAAGRLRPPRPIFDQPTAALLTDLKQRGLLDETLVLWTTEFGRMPTHQAGVTGRDHNPDGFTCWMMGAGVKGGATIGATDEFGRRAAVDPVTVWDFYATALHILGFDHTRLTYYHNGLNRRLTDVHGSVLQGLLA